jgi:hypothetical protein
LTQLRFILKFRPKRFHKIGPSPVCLPGRNVEFAGQRCKTTGWGKDAFSQGSYQQGSI